jgi:hypothetical protein
MTSLPDRVIIAGATGLIGRHLIEALRARGAAVGVVTRDPARAQRLFGDQASCYPLADHKQIETGVNGATAVVNLAGASIAGRRWTAAYKQLIASSRVDTTNAIVDAIGNCAQKPAVLINGSAVGYYGPHGDERLDESATPVRSFLTDVCLKWEAAADSAAQYGVRVVKNRTGIVLARNGGALAKMTPPFKAFVGGPLGSGKQGMSWIHIDDEIGIIMHALANAGVSGAINSTAPNPVDNKTFSTALGHVLHRPAFMPAPALPLRIMMGEMADEMLLTGQFVIPKKAIEAGYMFRFPELEPALRDIFK